MHLTVDGWGSRASYYGGSCSLSEVAGEAVEILLREPSWCTDLVHGAFIRAGHCEGDPEDHLRNFREFPCGEIRDFHEESDSSESPC